MATRYQSRLRREDDAHPFLADGALHVWQARLAASEDERAEFTRLLSPDERARADRFYFERDRRHFIAGRGILRSILSRYLACLPEEIAFLYGPKGKPSLPGAAIQFNLAHSDGLAVLAVARGGMVGIDLERIRPMQDWDRVMNSVFTVAEIEAIAALPPADQLRAFFTCWTRKEAYVKATGDGITVPLQHFSVPVVPGSPPCMVQVEGASQDITRWSFHELPLGPEYVGTVAFEGVIQRIQHCLWCGL
jgi:4'-phosphopantetheinyl transferase